MSESKQSMACCNAIILACILQAYKASNDQGKCMIGGGKTQRMLLKGTKQAKYKLGSSADQAVTID